MNKKIPVIGLILIAGILPVVWYALNVDHLQPIEPDITIHHIPLLDQTLVVITAFIIKPLYMLISLGLAWKLTNRYSPGLTALRWGLIAFFIGETFCSINYLFFQEKSIFSEYLHNFGMVVAFGFIVYAFWEGLDSYLINFSQSKKRCAFISLCGSCIKVKDVPCRLRQIFQLMVAILIFFPFIPLLAEIRAVNYNTYIFNTLYNYTRSPVHQAFEIRYSPGFSLVCFLTTFFVLLWSKEKQIPKAASILFSAGVGALGFSCFRLFFNSVFYYNLSWAASWEEITEFTLVVIITFILWIFRKSLKVDNEYL
jgi:hypothetical protein